jgi:hypothetical protein
MKVQTEEILEPGLREYLALLRPVPRRDPVAAAQAKAKFLAELEVLMEPGPPPKPWTLTNPAGWLESLNIRFEKPLVSFHPIPRTVLSFSSILFIVIVLFLGWVGITARAAGSALPGDSLYSFKTGIEQVQVAFAGDLDKQAGLYLAFAAHRLQEIDRLVDAGRYQKAVDLSAKFSSNIQKALEITNNLAKDNPARAAQRRNEIDRQLVDFTAQLTELLNKMPPAYQPAFNHVIPTSQPGKPTPLAPVMTQTPEPAVEQDVPENGNSNEQNGLSNGSDVDSNKDSGKDLEKEDDSGNSSEEDAESDLQEESYGNSEVNNYQSIEASLGSENTNPEQCQPGNESGAQGDHNSNDTENKPPE